MATRPVTREADALKIRTTMRAGGHPTGGATFRATRDDLVAADPLLGSAEIARTYCTNADRLASVVAITPSHLRRVDCWLGGVGFVTLAASPDPAQPMLGSVSDRDRAPELVVALVESLVGALPTVPVEAPVEVGPVGDIAPGGLPDDVGWMVIVTARSDPVGARSDRIVVAGRSGGLAMARPPALDAIVRAGGAPRAEVQRGIAAVLGPAPRSVEDLLADDDPLEVTERALGHHLERHGAGVGRCPVVDAGPRSPGGPALPDWTDAARARPAGDR